MAIQHRRGVGKDFDPTKLLPGEYAVVLREGAGYKTGVYICITGNDVRRLVTETDVLDTILNVNEEYLAEEFAKYTTEIGKVESLKSDETPKVINVGEHPKTVLDFYIPKGKQGIQGEKGDTGAAGIIEDVNTGLIGFNVEQDGHLYCYYNAEDSHSQAQAERFSLSDDGHLLYEVA